MSSASGLSVSITPLKTVRVRQLGLVDYQTVWREMADFTNQRDPKTPDELWLVEHPPVYTLGQAGKPEHLLAPGDIPVVQCDRGGQVTYHGPGQLVAYPLMNLPRLKLGVRQFVSHIEETLIVTLAHFNIAARRKDGAPGVYTSLLDGREAKIAALGLRVRRGSSFHGMSLNVAMDLEPFQRINPCGYAGQAVTQISEFDQSHAPSLEAVKDQLVKSFCQVFEVNPNY